MTMKGHGEEIQLDLGSDFVSYTERIQDEINIEESEVVFCGFGITAPEYGWNDFAGMDVKGKTVVVLVNDPGFGSDDPSFFKGNTMTYYGRWTYKYEEAARQGAEALLIIHETTSAGYPWFVVESSWSGSALHLRSPDGNKDKAAVQGWITLDVAKELFEAMGVPEVWHHSSEHLQMLRLVENQYQTIPSSLTLPGLTPVTIDSVSVVGGK